MSLKIIIPAVVTILLSGTAAAQVQGYDSLDMVTDTISGDIDLFSNDEILNVSLRFDIQEYLRKKSRDEYLDAILTYHLNDRDSVNKHIKLTSRGITRHSICGFPPLSLNFKKAGFESNLKKIKKIKMVTHCQSGNEEYLFKEYLIYKLYNALTEYSFKVRLMKVDYISTGSKPRTIRSYAFLIEPLDLLAERTHSTPVGILNLSPENIIPSSMDRVAVFNYMIGNTDWSVAGQHNIKVVAVADPAYAGRGAIVPYDFDYSGLVDAHYAIPTKGLGLQTVRERYYTGICRSAEVFRSDLKEFADRKEEFYSIIKGFPLLSEKSKRKITGYLDEFYAGLEKDNLKYIFQRECRTY